jgi:hypothetical protein
MEAPSEDFLAFSLLALAISGCGHSATLYLEKGDVAKSTYAQCHQWLQRNIETVDARSHLRFPERSVLQLPVLD